MNRLVSYAMRKTFAGFRLGQPVIASLGAAVSLIGWLRRRNAGSGKELIYSANLDEGESVRVRFLRGQTVVGEETIEG